MIWYMITWLCDMIYDHLAWCFSPQIYKKWFLHQIYNISVSYSSSLRKTTTIDLKRSGNWIAIIFQGKFICGQLFWGYFCILNTRNTHLICPAYFLSIGYHYNFSTTWKTCLHKYLPSVSVISSILNLLLENLKYIQVFAPLNLHCV